MSEGSHGARFQRLLDVDDESAQLEFQNLRVGVAPIRGEVPIYEGSHRIVVTVGQSKWTDTFRLQARQRVSFNVALQ